MTTTWHDGDYKIEYSAERLCISKHNMFMEFVGRDNVLAFCDATDDLTDLVTICKYFEINFHFTNED